MLKISSFRYNQFLRKRNKKKINLHRFFLINKKKRKKIRKLVSLGLSGVDQLFRINVFKTISLKLLKKGKARLSEKLVNKVFFVLRSKKKRSPHKLLSEIFNSLKSSVGIRIYKKGRKILRIPYLVPENKQYSVAARFLVLSARSRSEKSMVMRLANAILEAAKKKGPAFKRRQQIRVIADQNSYLVRKIKRKFKRYKKHLHR